MINSLPAENSKPFITVNASHIHKQVEQATRTDTQRHCRADLPTGRLLSTLSQEKEKDEHNDMQEHGRTQRRMHAHKRLSPKAASFDLLNIPPRSVNLHSAGRLPPAVSQHSPGTNTKPSQGHLQDCFGQQFLPNSQIASPVTGCLTFTRTRS